MQIKIEPFAHTFQLIWPDIFWMCSNYLFYPFILKDKKPSKEYWENKNHRTTDPTDLTYQKEKHKKERDERISKGVKEIFSVFLFQASNP